MKFLYGIYFFLRYLVDGGRLAYSHSEISFVGRNEGVNGDIRYSDIVAKTRVNFVSKFNFFCSSSRDPSDYMRFIPLKCHLFSVKRGK